MCKIKIPKNIINYILKRIQKYNRIILAKSKSLDDTLKAFSNLVDAMNEITTKKDEGTKIKM
ncbi:hypothetical protein FL857_08710 [Criibacterium bergeronii]|uniref:Uncharacterized protein n=1 Tax=Criibacterium bergeronii TaxID=1871336 RepID=A0A552V122_9FIRM|nr:hypothetical protein FL857_08710 [Criibacterium bergeronii]